MRIWSELYNPFTSLLLGWELADNIMRIHLLFLTIVLEKD